MKMCLVMILVKKVFIFSKTMIICLLCPLLCGLFFFWKGAKGELSYKVNNKKEPCTITRSFSLSYIFIYVLGLLNIPLIHVFSTYMLGILRIHHPSLHYNMSEFHFLQYQRRLIYQPSPMSVSCQSTSVV